MYMEQTVAAHAPSVLRGIATGADVVQAPPSKTVLLCNLEQHSAMASVELARCGWSIADRSTLPLDNPQHLQDLDLQERATLPSVGLIYVGQDVQAVHNTLKQLDAVLPARFLWLALLPPLPRTSTEHEQVRALVAEYCFDYFTLPVNWDFLAHTLGHALGMLSLAGTPSQRGGLFTQRDLLGESEPMRALLQGIRKAAQHQDPVMIAGEPGSGRTMAAQAIHARSLRAAAPFAVLNCQQYSHAALQSILCGTPAHPGPAQGGTLLLHNVHLLPFEGQQTLLRLLDHGHSGDALQRADVRIISSIDSSLSAQTPHTLPVTPGALTSELYYRLNVLSLYVPALRERDGDVHLLARHFLSVHAGQSPRRLRGFTKDAQEALSLYHWPGNVRELSARMRRAIAMCEGRSVSAQDLGLEGLAPSANVQTLEQARDQATITAIQNALARNRYRYSLAARDLDVSRVTLYRLIDRYQIKVRGSKPKAVE
jgi:DNA-binding NtrC family response regulator